METPQYSPTPLPESYTINGYRFSGVNMLLRSELKDQPLSTRLWFCDFTVSEIVSLYEQTVHVAFAPLQHVLEEPYWIEAATMERVDKAMVLDVLFPERNYTVRGLLAKVRKAKLPIAEAREIMEAITADNYNHLGNPFETDPSTSLLDILSGSQENSIIKTHYK